MELRRRPFRFAGVDESLSSPQFSREWETGGGEAERPELPAGLGERLAERFRPEVERLEGMTGRRFGWGD